MKEKRKRISLESLISERSELPYSLQYERIIKLINEGRISPVKGSPMNGMNPPLPVRFTGPVIEEDHSAELDELRYNTSLLIDTSYYLTHPEVYRKERSYVISLGDYLDKYGKYRKPAVSENERCFEIWHREKFIEKEGGRTILSHCGVTEEELSMYMTVEPLACFTIEHKEPQTVLIIENEDTFYSMRRYMLSGHRTILGSEINTIVYGAGKRMESSAKEFDLSVEPDIGAVSKNVLYFGDLDYEGIGIFERTAAIMEKYKVTPFQGAYGRMIKKAEAIGLDKLPDTKKGQNKNISGSFFLYFDETLSDIMKKILEAGKYIPQEILNVNDFGVE